MPLKIAQLSGSQALKSISLMARIANRDFRKFRQTLIVRR